MHVFITHASVPNLYSCATVYTLSCQVKNMTATLQMSDTVIMLNRHIHLPSWQTSAKMQPTSISISYIIARYVPTRHMTQKYHTYVTYSNYFLFRYQKSVSAYTYCELIAINSVTRNTGIHTFHIIGNCPWTNVCHIAGTCPTTLLLQTKNRPHNTSYISKRKTKCNFNLPMLLYIYHK